MGTWQKSFPLCGRRCDFHQDKQLEWERESKKCLQFSGFSDKFKFLLKSKMAAILAAILDNFTDPTHNIYFIL